MIRSKNLFSSSNDGSGLFLKPGVAKSGPFGPLPLSFWSGIYFPDINYLKFLRLGKKVGVS